MQITVEAFMRTVRDNVERGDNVYLRGFGSFIVKKKLRGKEEIFLQRSLFSSLLQHSAFKPAKEFLENVKEKVAVKA